MDTAKRQAPPPLTPLDFLNRSGALFSERTAIIDGDKRFTYAEFLDRSQRLSAALRASGIRPGERVAALCVNSHVMLEMHNGVPGAGVALAPLNTRLAASDLVTILEHLEPALLFADGECGELAQLVGKNAGVRVILADGPHSEYEQFLAAVEPTEFVIPDESDVLTINYTSGSTGRPKGVMYTHRGAYLQSVAMVYHLGLQVESSYLWTLPMFHCDGWCHTWAVTAAGAMHCCVRRTDAEKIWTTISSGTITHLAGAPTVLSMIAEAAAASSLAPPERPVLAAVGGAPPTPALLGRILPLNISVVHMYGLTETYGPAVVNQWKPEWSTKSRDELLAIQARQGVGNIATIGVRVVDEMGNDVPDDGQAIGEIVFKGNNVMAGYFRDEKSTSEVFIDGWFRSGDLGVRHSDGYIEVRDRAKDIVIVGGENVSSLEVERLICEHPAVLEAAVVSYPDDRWGEVPVAVVALRNNAKATETEIIEFVRGRTAHFKAPKMVHFVELPKTSTGKVQKHVLRAWVRGESRGT